MLVGDKLIKRIFTSRVLRMHVCMYVVTQPFCFFSLCSEMSRCRVGKLRWFFFSLKDQGNVI